jgi:hypothetical protein
MSSARGVTAALNDKRRDGVLVRDGNRNGMIVFRIAQDGEGVRCPKRQAGDGAAERGAGRGAT